MGFMLNSDACKAQSDYRVSEYLNTKPGRGISLFPLPSLSLSLSLSKLEREKRGRDVTRKQEEGSRRHRPSLDTNNNEGRGGW